MSRKTPWLIAFLGLTLVVAVAYHHHRRAPLADAAVRYSGAGLESRANTPPGMSNSLGGPGAANGIE